MFTELLVKRENSTQPKKYSKRELMGKKGKEANKIAIHYMYKYTIFFFFGQKEVDGRKKA